MVCLEDLSPELLIKIFEYINIRDLYQLQKTCRYFFNIIRNATSLGNTVPLVVTNQLRQEMRNRSVKLLTLREKCHISYNWRNGVYREQHMLKTKERYIPWLVLTKDHLWLSRGNKINAYRRKKRGGVNIDHASYTVEGPTAADICKFVYKYNCLISGNQSGDIHIWRSKEDSTHLPDCHKADVHSVDLEGSVFSSGSKDGRVNLWSLDTKPDQSCEPLFSYDLRDRIWSTALVGKGEHLAVGTAGLNSVPPLHIFDTTRCCVLLELGKNFRKGSGILQIKWESPSILLSGGYDKNIRMWDIRAGACVQAWEDPFYSTVYCFSTDNHCTVLTGTESHGRAVLWDIRTKHYVNMYFMETCKRAVFSSPVYGISFDAGNLFAATDGVLNIMDFSVEKGRIKNYSSIFSFTTGFFM